MPKDPIVSEHVEPLLTALAAEPPDFRLPPATLGHIRHFMPRDSLDLTKRTKVFDAFVAIDPEQDVVAYWPNAHLTPEAEQALDRLLARLGYFGRAESWCEARRLTDFDQARINCRPWSAEADGEPVRVLAPVTGWNGWSYKKNRPKPCPTWNLLAETADMHADGERWSDPPGSRWLNYARPTDAFAPRPAVHRAAAPTERPRFTVARYALDFDGHRPLPLVADTLPVAEAVRTALLRHRKSLFELDSPGLSGKDEGGVLRHHRQAFYLPTDEDGDGRIDHCTVYRPAETDEAGFTRGEVGAIDELREVTFAQGTSRQGTLRLLLTDLGVPAELDRIGLIFGTRDIWVSAMPYIATRHVKRRGGGRGSQPFFDPAAVGAFLATDLARHWAGRNDLPGWLSTPPAVKPLFGPVAAAETAFRSLRFRRSRANGHDDGGSRFFGAFRLRFAEPVSGPICLGDHSRFGTGRFVPE